MKETREKMTTRVDSTPSCARAEDLVAYLYGEADVAAAQDFEAHSQHCVSCRTELAAFGQVRVSIGEWRKQALGALASPIMATSSPVITAPNNNAPERKRSAMAALREFFNLSPVWMRAATATLVVVFCALVALTIVRFYDQPKSATTEKNLASKPSEKESNAMAEKQAQQNVETIAEAPKDELAVPVVKTASDENDNVRRQPNRAMKQNASGQQKLAGKQRLKISPQESRELARDLRLVASNDEDDLPRLSDLLGETN